MPEYALRLSNGADTRDRVRKADALALAADGPLVARGGLRRDGGGEVTVVEGSMVVEVSPFMAWVPGGASTAQGGYPFVRDDTKQLAIADGDANADRVDVVAAVVRDDAYDGSGFTEATVEVVEGTPGGGTPALPASALALRNIEVPARVSAGTGGLSSSNLGSDRRQYLAGGVLTVSGVSARDALPPLGGQVIYREDTGRLELYDGSRWGAVYPSDLQTATLTSGLEFNRIDAQDVLSITVECPGPQAVYLVTATLDVDTDGGNTAFCQIYAGDTGAVSGSLIKSAGGRMSLSRSWRVSDMSAGSQTIRLTCRRTGSGVVTVRSSHTELLVDRRA